MKTLKPLYLSLKREWFEMTKFKGKTEDYRELTVYWLRRLVTKECRDSGDVLVNKFRQILVSGNKS